MFGLAQSTMTSIAGPSKKLLPRGVEETSPEMSLSVLSSEDYETTSSLQYVNSQLMAHGFVRCPGLSLDGLAQGDSERVVKCLLAMLGQRMVRSFALACISVLGLKQWVGGS